jgi:hypothetical protein
MAVDAAAVETYDNSVIREDLAEQFTMISPEEVPFQTAIGQDSATNTLHEWPIVDLAAPDATNRVIEGDDAPATDAGTLALRLNNYTQISDKKIVVTQTSEAVDAAAENVQREAKQISLKLREMKRDLEVMLTGNDAAAAGSSGTARATAGIVAFIRTNTTFEAGGADPTLSGTTEGFPDAGATPGTAPIALTEDAFNDSIEQAWIAGGNPTIAMVNSNNKRVISETFTGSSTRYKDAIDKTLVNAIDVYDSDFGQFSIVPNRFQATIDTDNYYVLILDPDLCSVSYLETARQKPLAETGHSRSRLAWCEYGLTVFNEAGLAIIRDTNGAAT